MKINTTVNMFDNHLCLGFMAFKCLNISESFCKTNEFQLRHTSFRTAKYTTYSILQYYFYSDLCSSCGTLWLIPLLFFHQLKTTAVTPQ